MVALDGTTLASLPEGIGRPGYDRRRVTAGVAHFGVGNFHRAHQAAYLDRLLALPGHEGWGILGIGVLDDAAERAKAASLARQDGLYTLSLFPPQGEPASAVIGSLVGYLFAPDDPAAVLERLADPAIRVASLTITEGGYNLDLATGAFRLDAPGVVHDLAHPETPRTVFGFLVGALARRRARKVPPFSVLSCDNLQHNGAAARRAVLAFAGARDPGLAAWIEASVAFPSCMVDRIAPAVTPADARRLNHLTGVEDEVPVFAEDFAQWVVEDRFCHGRPELEAVGVQFTEDVGAYEQVKLRVLNAAHSVLAYLGLLGGHRFVHEAVADQRILGLLRAFLDHDVIPLLHAPPGVALDRYRDAVLARFANPAMRDQLLRIAADGGTKIPVFLGDTFRARLEQGDGGDHRRLAFLLAAFARYLAGVDDRGTGFVPHEPQLSAADRAALVDDADPAAVLRIRAFKGLGLEGSEAFALSFARYRAMIAEKGALATLAALG